MKAHYINGAMYNGCSDEHFTTYNPANPFVSRYWIRLIQPPQSVFDWGVFSCAKEKYFQPIIPALIGFFLVPSLFLSKLSLYHLICLKSGI